MSRYIDHIRSKEPHERRRHALSVAGVITGVFALAWLGSFGARMGGQAATEQAAAVEQAQQAQAAAAGEALMQNGQAQLLISTTSVYSVPAQGQ